MADQMVTMRFEITATPRVMERFKRLLARIERNARVGHSAKVGMAVDGDGGEKFTAAGPGYNARSYDAEMTWDADAGGGYGVEMAGEDHYYRVLERQRGSLL